MSIHLPIPHIYVMWLCSVTSRWTWICRAQLSYINSFDMHMQKHFQSMHIYLNILNMLKDSQYICVNTCIRFSGLMLYLDNPNIGCASKMTIHFGAQYISRTRMILVVCKSFIIRRKWKWVDGCIYYLFSSAIHMACSFRKTVEFAITGHKRL